MDPSLFFFSTYDNRAASDAEKRSTNDKNGLNLVTPEHTKAKEAEEHQQGQTQVDGPDCEIGEESDYEESDEMDEGDKSERDLDGEGDEGDSDDYSSKRKGLNGVKISAENMELYGPLIEKFTQEVDDIEEHGQKLDIDGSSNTWAGTRCRYRLSKSLLIFSFSHLFFCFSNLYHVISRPARLNDDGTVGYRVVAQPEIIVQGNCETLMAIVNICTIITNTNCKFLQKCTHSAHSFS